MTQVQSFLDSNQKYLQPDSDSAVAISQIPDAAWPFVLEALDEHSGGATDPGIDCAVAITRESLEDFKTSRANHWSEQGHMTALVFGPYPALKFNRFQLRRGDTRRDSLVIDLGEIRVVLY